MKKNMFINLIMLSVTSFLLVLVLMAWYVSNQQVSASGITGKTEDGSFTLELERGTYNSANTEKWTWDKTKALSISNMQPNDVFFFRFKITAKNGGSLKVKLSGIESAITSSVTVSGTSVLIGGVKYFDLANNKVTVKNGDTTLGTLYNYSNSELSLADFKVEDTFKFYDYGIGTVNFYKPDSAIYYTDSISEAPNSGVVLSNITTTYSNLSEGVSYGYFALEFNDALSLKTYTHLDGTVKTDNNLYQAQTLSISSISVESSTI